MHSFERKKRKTGYALRLRTAAALRPSRVRATVARDPAAGMLPARADAVCQTNWLRLSQQEPHAHSRLFWEVAPTRSVAKRTGVRSRRHRGGARSLSARGRARSSTKAGGSWEVGEQLFCKVKASLRSRTLAIPRALAEAWLRLLVFWKPAPILQGQGCCKVDTRLLISDDD